MHSSRRDFVQHVAAGAVGITGLAGLELSLPSDLRATTTAQSPAWDISWTTRLKGKHKACFDCTEPESGYGVWRASAWAGQYMDVMKVTAADLSPVVILRHNAIILALQQSFWDKYGIGKAKGVMHPLTGEPTDRNPAMLGAADGLPEPMQGFALSAFIARGGVALACDLALQDMVGIIQSTDKVSEAVAKEQAKNWLVPGVILQPSGVFAVLRAQQAQALYIRAS